MHASIFALFSISLPLLGLAAPLSHNSTLARRADCTTTTPGRANAPCICGKKVGLRLGDVRPRCTLNKKAVVFKNPTSTTDFSVKVDTTFTASAVQCDHIVELQFIANQINNGDPAICTGLVDATTGNPTPAFETFFQKINSQDNLVFVDSTINAAKGVIVSGGTLGSTKTKKSATGVVNYLKLMEASTTHPSFNIAQDISDTLDTIVGAGNGFNSLKAVWIASVDSFVKNLETCQIPNLTRRDEVSFWRRLVSPFSSRALSCPLPPTTSKPPTTPITPVTNSTTPVKPPTAPVVPPVKPPTTPVKPPTAPIKPPTAPVKPPTVPVKPPTAPAAPPVKPVAPISKPPVAPVKPVVKPPVAPAVKPAVAPAIKPVVKPVVKTATKPKRRMA